MDDAFVEWDTASTYKGMYVSACVIVYILHSVISSPVSPLAKSDLAIHKQIFDFHYTRGEVRKKFWGKKSILNFEG